MSTPAPTPTQNPAQTKEPPDLVKGHTVRGYDRDLTRLRGLILEMGERVVEQTQTAVMALLEGDLGPAFRVLDREPQIDYLALDADDEAYKLIARRQPKAVDLRIVLALGRIANEAERAGDKAARIADRTIVLRQEGTELSPALCDRLRRLDELVCCAFERAMEAVGTFDTQLALTVFEDEAALDQANADLVQHLTSGKEGLPLSQLESLFAMGHALNRIGNHAATIAEQVIYVAEGQDVRFRNREILIETLRHREDAPA
jgi:phosphate transport system protein